MNVSTNTVRRAVALFLILGSPSSESSRSAARDRQPAVRPPGGRPRTWSRGSTARPPTTGSAERQRRGATAGLGAGQAVEQLGHRGAVGEVEAEQRVPQRAGPAQGSESDAYLHCCRASLRRGQRHVEHDLDVVAHLQRAHQPAVGLDAPARSARAGSCARDAAVRADVQLERRPAACVPAIVRSPVDASRPPPARRR